MYKFVVYNSVTLCICLFCISLRVSSNQDLVVSDSDLFLSQNFVLLQS